MIPRLVRDRKKLYYFDDNRKNHGGQNPQMLGDCSKLRGNCSGLSGNCTGLIGDCTGLIGNCSDLRGDCSDLWGDCTGIRGECTGLTGSLDSCQLSDDERKAVINIEDLVIIVNPAAHSEM